MDPHLMEEQIGEKRLAQTAEILLLLITSTTIGTTTAVAKARKTRKPTTTCQKELGFLITRGVRFQCEKKRRDYGGDDVDVDEEGMEGSWSGSIVIWVGAWGERLAGGK